MTWKNVIQLTWMTQPNFNTAPNLHDSNVVALYYMSYFLYSSEGQFDLKAVLLY